MGLFFRFVIFLLIFGGGFFAGVKFAENQYVQDPGKLAELMKKSVKATAAEQLDKAKKMLEK